MRLCLEQTEVKGTRGQSSDTVEILQLGEEKQVGEDFTRFHSVCDRIFFTFFMKFWVSHPLVTLHGSA